MKKIFFLISILIGLTACSKNQVEVESDQQKTNSNELILEGSTPINEELESESKNEELTQLTPPTNIVGTYDSSSDEFKLTWDYEFPDDLEEDKYGEFYFVICADDVYGETFIFSYNPKNLLETSIQIDDFLNNILTRNIYIYAQQGIEDVQRRSEKSEPFQYKESDPEPMFFQPFE